MDVLARRPTIHRSCRSAITTLVCGFWLSGCAGVGDSMVSGAFVDPARYDLYDCPRLEAERTALTNRTAELQGLIDKANTGVGGAVIGEAVYRNDYISARAQMKLVDEMRVRNRCPGATPPR